MCTTDAGYGPGWPVTDGNFTDLSFDNFTPWSCPQCGCYGNYKAIVLQWIILLWFVSEGYGTQNFILLMNFSKLSIENYD